MLREQLESDGLSFPRIATILRRFAIEHKHVNRIDLYHTGERYSLAILLKEPVTVARIREINQDIKPLLKAEFSASDPAVYIVGSQHASADMFYRSGSTIIHKSLSPQTFSL